jgi:hypothetical protein
MQTDAAKKTCKMCCMEIPRDARKRPYCQHFQNRATTLLYHPAFAVLCACLPLAGMMIISPRFLTVAKSKRTTKTRSSSQISQLAFGETKLEKRVDVIGTIKNASSISWKEVQFHVDFLNATGKRIDVGHKEQYSFYLPANGTSSFKVSFTMDFPETNYAKPVVSVSTAKDARARW